MCFRRGPSNEEANNTLLFWVCVAMGAGCSESDSQEPQSPAPDAMLQADMSTADVSVVDVSMMDNDAQIVDLRNKLIQTKMAL